MQAGMAMRRRIVVPGGRPEISADAERPLQVSQETSQTVQNVDVSLQTHLYSWRNYSNGSSSEGIDCKALFSADVSFPPASAKSGLPPPEPPTCLASCCISLPAWILEVRSLGTPAIRATLPSSGMPRATTPEPSFWRKEATS